MIIKDPELQKLFKILKEKALEKQKQQNLLKERKIK